MNLLRVTIKGFLNVDPKEILIPLMRLGKNLFLKILFTFRVLYQCNGLPPKLLICAISVLSILYVFGRALVAYRESLWSATISVRVQSYFRSSANAGSFL